MTVQTLEKQVDARPLSTKDARWLYTHYPPRPIHNSKDHADYKEVVKCLVEDEKIGGEYHLYLETVIHFLDEYERKRYPSHSKPEDILRFLMEQHHIKQSDLANEFGGQSIVSNILRGKRKMTRDHIEKLSRLFSLSPASFYTSYA